LFGDGRFQFTKVAPGDYVIEWDRGAESLSQEGDFAALPLAVAGRDILDLTLRASPGATVSGRISYRQTGRGPTPSSNDTSLSAIPTDLDVSPGGWAHADVRQDGTFEMAGLHGPRRIDVARVPAGWRLQSIVDRGVDVTDSPVVRGRSGESVSLDVVLTDRANRVTCDVTDAERHKAPGARVIVFSTNPERWYLGSRFVRTAPSDPDGHATFIGLPSDTYYVVAVNRLPIFGTDGWRDPDVLETIRVFAMTATINEDQDSNVSVRLTGAKGE